MGNRTTIAWTDSTWNPVTGCDKISPACDNCYAESIAHRFGGTPAYPNGFHVTLRPERLNQPLSWTKPRRVFVNSMSDVFHPSIPDDYIAQVFAVMALAQRHQFQVLTKRHARMRALLTSPAFRATVFRHANAHASYERPEESASWPLPNVWVGVSVEDQKWADIRIPALLDTPAAVRFISAEPLLGPIDLTRIRQEAGIGGFYQRNALATTFTSPQARHSSTLNWVIVGGESGHSARPMHLEWATDLRDQCENHAVPFLFKQAGTILARSWGVNGKGEDPDHWLERFPRQFPAPAKSSQTLLLGSRTVNR